MSAYLALTAAVDAAANLVVSVQNRAGIAVGNVVVGIEYTDSAGRIRQSTKKISGTLQPGQIAQVNTGLGPYTGSTCPVRVLGASVVN